MRKTVVVFNHLGDAPREVSGGTGTIRGGDVKAAGRTSVWVRSTASRSNNVELYITANDEKEGNRGLGCTTLAKVAFFFTHQANDWRKGNNEIIPPGEFTVWPG